MARILIVDDDRSFLDSLGETLRSLGHEVVACDDGHDGLATVAMRAVDLAIVDFRMPGLDGLGMLRAIRADPHHARLPVVLLTAHADADNTIEAMKVGAFDHLTKPIGRADVVALLERVLVHRRATADVLATDPPAGERVRSSTSAGVRMIGASPAMRAVQKMIGISADSDATVLIQGETGTGKELVAHAIHDHSDRGRRTPPGPFVALNCASIPAELLESELFGHEKGAFSGASQGRPGRFREADGGTLFMDEIGDMSLAMQAKVLRVLQDRDVTPVGGQAVHHVDVRVLAATHRDLVEMVEQGRFREDLFYRLNVLHIELPPLRDRGSDILVLAEEMIERFAATPKRLSADAAKALLDHRWPGNVRELGNLMQKLVLVVRGPVIGVDDLQLKARASDGDGPTIDEWTTMDFATAVARFERMLLERALAETGNNRSAAARRLGIHRPLLYAKLKEHGLE